MIKKNDIYFDLSNISVLLNYCLLKIWKTHFTWAFDNVEGNLNIKNEGHVPKKYPI